MIKIFIRKINSVFYYFQRDMTLLLKIVIKKINFFKLLVKRKLIYNKLKVGIGTIFYIQGGVANHILSLNKSALIMPAGKSLGQFFSTSFKFVSISFGRSL